MKVLSIYFLISALAIPFAHAHDEPSRVGVELRSTDQVQAGSVLFSFNLIDSQTQMPLKSSDLEITNEKILHCYIYDGALKEFKHEHPTFDGDAWHVSTNLNTNGRYWIFFQGQIANGHQGFASGTRFNVGGGLPANPEPPILGDMRTGNNGLSAIKLSNEKIVAGKPAMLMLYFRRTDGSTPAITPWLGALAHVTIVSAEGDSLVHVHPMSSGTNELMLHTEFNEAGDYRIWVQFLDQGELKTVALSVIVQ